MSTNNITPSCEGQRVSLIEKIKSASTRVRGAMHDAAIGILGRKKFKIIGERKKFAVRWTPNITSNDSTTNKNISHINLSKKDAIVRMNFDDRAIEWARQRDNDSCGYCLLKNLSNYTDIKVEWSIGDLYQTIIEMSNRERPPENQTDRRWLNSGEIEKYIKEFTSYNPLSYGWNSTSHALSRIRSNRFSCVIMEIDSHWVWLVSKWNGQYYFLDSKNSQPQVLNIHAALQKANEAMDRGYLYMYFNPDQFQEAFNERYPRWLRPAGSLKIGRR